MRLQDQLRALLDDKPGPFSPHWINHARRLMTQAAHALDAADEALTAQPADARPPLPYTPDHVDPHAVREAVAALAQQAEPVAERARQLWNTIKILGLGNDNLALFAIRTALTSQLAPPTVALKSVHLTRDVQGMCEVLVNGRVVIRDNGDIINHFATPDWFAAPRMAKILTTRRTIYD